MTTAAMLPNQHPSPDAGEEQPGCPERDQRECRRPRVRVSLDPAMGIVAAVIPVTTNSGVSQPGLAAVEPSESVSVGIKMRGSPKSRSGS
jgi:hypothetical protein